MEPRTSGGPRRIGNWRAEYIADFRDAAKRSLLEGKRPGRKARPLPDHWRLFESYIMTFPPDAAFGDDETTAQRLNRHARIVRHHLRLKERTFYRRVEQIRDIVGAELARCELLSSKSYRSKKPEPIVIEDYE
jgi:hypothetical protein